MIEQVLDRRYVLRELDRTLDAIHSTLASDDARRSGGTTIASLPHATTPADLEAAARALADARAEETLTPETGTAPAPAPAPDARRGGMPAAAPTPKPPAPEDEAAFFARSPEISLLQSALERFYDTQQPGAVGPVPAPPSDRRSGLRSPAPTAPSASRRLFNAFSESDPRWVGSLVAEGLRYFRGKHAFGVAPADLPIADKARLLIVGDWGSGVPRAQTVARQMRRVIEQGKEAGLEQHVVHLGDVYYSGWDWEYKKRFLPYWPVYPEEADRITSWSLNGNHDMYSGGFGYFDTLLRDTRFQCHNDTSYFRLANDHWQFLGLDTAYEENSLGLPGDGPTAPQRDWLLGHLGASSPRKTMLLSHHQLISAYEKSALAVGPDLRARLDAGAVRAWLWGHEHRCVLYGAQAGVAFPRCIGHGGVPVYMVHPDTGRYDAPVSYEYRHYIPGGFGGAEHWAIFGFAVLDLDGPRMQVRYIYEDGFEHSEVID